MNSFGQKLFKVKRKLIDNSVEIFFIVLLFLLVYFSGINNLLSTWDKSLTAFIALVAVVIAIILAVLYVGAVFKNKSKFKQTRDMFLAVVSVVMMLSATTLIGIQVIKFFSDQTSNQQSSLAAVGFNETLLGLIALLVAFAGLLAYIFQRIIRKDLEDKIQKLAEQEHIVSKVESNIVAGFVLWFQLDKEGIKDSARISFINEAIDFTKIALKASGKLDKDEHVGLIGKCKNNLAFYLAERGHHVDAKEAFRLARDLLKMFNDRENEEKHESTYSYLGVWAKVMWSYGSEKEKSAACRVIKKLLGTIDMPKSERDDIENHWKNLLGEEDYKGLIGKDIELLFTRSDWHSSNIFS